MNDVSQMEAGRELDALVAEKVMGQRTELVNRPMGWRVNADGSRGAPLPNPILELRDEHGAAIMVHGEMMHGYFPCPVPDYSTQIAAAWTVVEKLRLAVSPQGDGHGWVAQYGKFDWSLAGTAPLAICRAALRAVGS